MLHWIGNNLGTILITLRSLPWWQPSSGAFTKAGAPGRAPAAAAAPTAPWRAPATAPTARRNDSDRRAAQRKRLRFPFLRRQRKRRLPCGSASHTRDRLSIQELDRQGKGSRAAGLFRRAAVPGGCGNSPACWAGAMPLRRASGGRMGFGLPKNPASRQRQFAWKASASREDGFVPYAGCCDTIRKPSETEAPRDFRLGKPSG